MNGGKQWPSTLSVGPFPCLVGGSSREFVDRTDSHRSKTIH